MRDQFSSGRVRPLAMVTLNGASRAAQAYIVAGELTVERKKDGKKQRFTDGQPVSETVDIFQGVAGSRPLVLIVFYAEVQGPSPRRGLSKQTIWSVQKQPCRTAAFDRLDLDSFGEHDIAFHRSILEASRPVQ